MKHLIFIAAILLMATSCDELHLSDEDLTKANHQRDSLYQISQAREESIEAFLTSFNEIEKNLNDITEKQHAIYFTTETKGREFKVDQKDRINAEIAAINELMKQNSATIEDLKMKLKNSRGKYATLEKSMATLNEQLAQKNTELEQLNAKLNSLNIQVAQLQTTIDTLNSRSFAQNQSINANIEALHTAYYVVGEAKDLQESKLINKQGGLLGIGRTAKLNDNIDNTKFTTIDYTKTTSIPVNSNGIKIITTHPSDSYTLDKDVGDEKLIKNIVITNPEKFWSVSKYLVVAK